MSIQHLGQMLKVINDQNGENPFGICFACSHETGLSLTTGSAPTRLGEDAEDPKFGGVPKRRTFLKGEQGGVVFLYLWGPAQAGVYGVNAADDHSYNFLKYRGKLYLLDSSLHVFRQIRRREDFVVMTSEDEIDYAVAPDEDDGFLILHYYGTLHPTWYAVMEKHDLLVSRTAMGAYEVG
jgi:hypothetical protein